MTRLALSTALALALAVTTASGQQSFNSQAPKTDTPPSPEAMAIEKLLDAADVARNKGDMTEMIRLAVEATAKSRAINDEWRLGKSTSYLGTAHFLAGHMTECAAPFRESQAIGQKLKNTAIDGNATNGLGACLREAGDFEGSIDQLRRVADMMHASGNARNEVVALLNVSTTYNRIGETDMARAWVDRAVAAAATLPDTEGFYKTAVLQGRANLLAQAKDPAAAASAYREAIAIAPSTKPKGTADLMESELWVSLASVEWDSGHLEAAADAAQKSMDVLTANKLTYAQAEGLALSTIGRVRLKQGDRPNAYDLLLRARTVLERVTAPGASGMLLGNEIWIARALRANGRTAEALAIDEAVLRGLDRLRTGSAVTGTSSATAMLPQADAYTDTLDILMSLGRVEDAYQVSERYRSRAFLDTLDERRIGIGDVMTAAQHAREDMLLGKISSLQSQLFALERGDAKRKPIEVSLQSVDEDLDALRREIRRQDPRYGSLVFPEAAPISDTMKQLAADAVLLSYVVGTEHSFMWTISSSGVTGTTLPGQEDIDRQVNTFRTLISTKPGLPVAAGRAAEIRSSAAALTRMLLAPAVKSLVGKRRLIIAPDGSLNSLPFEALSAIGGLSGTTPTWLTEQFALSYVPSATVLATLMGRPAPPTSTTGLLAFGDPISLTFTALPFTRVEVDRIAKLFGTTAHTYLGTTALKDSVTSEPIGNFRYLHFAAHAFVNTSRPGLSGIVFSTPASSKTDSVLQADDVMRLRLNADLVTLSACSTGLGKVVAGEGVMGLARSFIYAGSRSVAASLWNVNDEATATLMESFYRGVTSGKSRDDALAAARLTLIRGSNARLRDPYYWAPFVLIGIAR